MTYEIDIAGLKRNLPLCKVSDDLYIGAFVMFGDVEMTVHCAAELLKRAPEYDYIIAPEAKSIPLLYEMARQSGADKYFLARKGPKAYMSGVFEVNVKSITTMGVQKLVIDSADAELIKGKRMLIIDDVISTGESLRAMEELVRQAGGIIAGKMAVLAEGAAAERDDIIVLANLPLFNPDGTVKAEKKLLPELFLCFFLPPIQKKTLKKRSAFLCADACIDAWPVMKVLREQIQDAAAGARVFFPGAENHPRYPRVDDGAGAHGTGLQCDIQDAVIPAPAPPCPAGVADGLDFGMGCGIPSLFPAVPAAADDIPVPVGDDAADGDIPVFSRIPGKCERQMHVLFMVHGQVSKKHPPAAAGGCSAFQGIRRGRR